MGVRLGERRPGPHAHEAAAGRTARARPRHPARRQRGTGAARVVVWISHAAGSGRGQLLAAKPDSRREGGRLVHRVRSCARAVARLRSRRAPHSLRGGLGADRDLRLRSRAAPRLGRAPRERPVASLGEMAARGWSASRSVERARLGRCLAAAVDEVLRDAEPRAVRGCGPRHAMDALARR